MKKIFYFILLSILFQKFIFPQEGWFWQNPLPTGNNLYSIKFIDENIGWIAGGAGIILKTTDGGDNWHLQYSGTSNDLYSIYFTDYNNGTAVGYMGTILRTTNSGNSWVTQASGTYVNLYDVCFTNVDNGFIGGNIGTLLHTSNGGTTWVSINNIPDDLYALTFSNTNDGWAVGIEIHKTTDAGNSWTSSYFSETFGLYGVSFMDQNKGTAVGIDNTNQNGIIIYTSNGGNTWNTQLRPSTGKLNDVTNFDSSNLITVGDYGVILKTSNEGIQWDYQVSGTTHNLNGVFFINENYAISVGDLGTILKSTDGGISWEFVTKGDWTITFRNVQAINENNIFTVGEEQYPNSGGVIFKTKDAGLNWTKQTFDIPNLAYFSGVSFLDSTFGFVAGGLSITIPPPHPSSYTQGIILKTTNSGVDWNQYLFQPYQSPTSVFMVDLYHATVVGGEGLILHTTNGGDSWYQQQSGTYLKLNDVFFTNPNHGITIGYSGIILKTTNGGTSWEQKISGTSEILKSVAFGNLDNGWIVGGGLILKTSDGGNTWFEQLNLPLAILNGVSFIDENNGSVTGYSRDDPNRILGIILRTTDGGITWNEQESNSTSYLYSISFSDSKHGVVVGSNGTILRTENGGFNVGNVLDELIGFELKQNYPNPFNSGTTINYKIPQTEFVTLKVYDILGREVATLVNDEKPAGSYKVQFNGNGLTSGIYFYQLKAGDYSETKKMVFLK